MGQIYLAITDGTTTITIADGAGSKTNWRLHYETWAPAIAGRRLNDLGGRGPYYDIAEEFILDVWGTSAANAYANLATLTNLLDQADSWAMGENVAAVLLKYSPDGATISSAATPLQATIFGRASGDNSAAVGLTAEFHDLTGQYVIRNVRVKILRRAGLWLHATDSASSAATTNGDLATVAMAGAVGGLSPTKITVSNFGLAGHSPTESYTNAFVLMANAANRLVIKNTKDMTGALDYSTVNDSANYCRATNVLRFTPTATTERAATAIAILIDAKRIALFANVRNNDATTTFKIRGRMYYNHSGAYTAPIVIPVSSGPLWRFLGIISLPVNPQYLQLLCTASAASGTLDIDSVIALGIEGPESAAVAIIQPSDAVSTHVSSLSLDHRLLSNVDPLALVGLNPISYQGDLVMPTKAANLYLAFLQGGSDGATITWREVASSAARQNVITLDRITAYRSPQ